MVKEEQMGGQVVNRGKVKYSVVIPVFNEEQTLEPLHSRLTAVMQNLGATYEIIFVDDGSTDGSPRILKELSNKDNSITVIRFTRNFGQHPAVSAGFDVTQGAVIITMDADLQNPPEEIPRLLEKINEGYEVVAGCRESRHDPIWRKLSSRFTNWLVSKLTGVKLKDQGCMLRAYRSEIIEMLKQCKEKSRFIPTLVSWLGVSLAEIKVTHDPRLGGKSKYNFPKLLKMYFDLVTGFSDLPIQIVTYAGFAVSFLGIGVGIYLVIWRIVFGPGISGLVSFVALGILLLGALLVALGLIGQYIGRIFVETQGRPYYIVKEMHHSRGENPK